MATGAQTKIDVLQIPAMIALRERPDGVQARARDVKAKANAVRKVDQPAGVDLGGDAIERKYVGCTTASIWLVRNRKAGELAVVGQRRDRTDVGQRSRGRREPFNEAGRHDGVGVQQDDVAG